MEPHHPAQSRMSGATKLVCGGCPVSLLDVAAFFLDSTPVATKPIARRQNNFADRV
jgi:hypothetical protein